MQQQKRHLRTEPLLHGQDNTEVIAFSLQNKGYTVGIPFPWKQDSIAPAVTKGKDTYGSEYEDSLVVEGGETK